MGFFIARQNSNPMTSEKRKRDLLQLRKEISIKASARWKERQHYRKDPSNLFSLKPLEKQEALNRLSNFTSRETLRGMLPPNLSNSDSYKWFERKIGNTLDFTKLPPNTQARIAGTPVARLHEIVDQGMIPDSFGTGFLISENLLMTNYHVFPSQEYATGCAANFLYEFTDAGLQAGVTFELLPGEFFISNEELDYAIVYVAPLSINEKTSLSSLGYIKLIETPGKVIIGQPINIIQYPLGGPKQYATTQNLLKDIIEDKGFLQYTTDTLNASSGAPAFNQYWEVVALHHSGVPYCVEGKIMSIYGKPWDDKTMSDDEVQWIANEGISISKIVSSLKQLNDTGATGNRIIKNLLNKTKDNILYGSSAEDSSRSTITTKELSANTMEKIINLNFYGNATVYVNSGTETQVAFQVHKQQDSTIVPTVEAKNVEKKIRFDEKYSDREGYKAGFLPGFPISLPTIDSRRKKEIMMHGTGPMILNYHHFSLIMNKKRRFQMYSAVNVDYSPDKRSKMSRVEYGRDEWRLDPRIPAELQIVDDEFYKPATRVDRGHIVMREDNCWGESDLEREYANADTFHWTNCTPQHEAFNQESQKGLWGKLEGYIQKKLDIVNNKASIFAGPVLNNEDDPEEDFGRGIIQYPVKFWKVLVVIDKHEGPLAYGFVLDQSAAISRFGLEAIDFRKFKSQQKTLKQITALTGVIFDNVLYDVDVLKNNTYVDANESLRIGSLSDIQLFPKHEVGKELEELV
jgi:endonuclease G